MASQTTGAVAYMMSQLNTRESDRCVPETLEADPGLAVAVVLLNQIIEIFRRSDLRVLRQQAIGLHLAHCTVMVFGGWP
ncbi:hypothetical protein AB4Y45_44105 [Paraburkholderia sp. EG287A]|uniref:hypothetical protein n=1 Tax=unclassified Paraburkholderia TaxID=2615204 RepID=UPI0034D2751D